MMRGAPNDYPNQITAIRRGLHALGIMSKTRQFVDMAPGTCRLLDDALIQPMWWANNCAGRARLPLDYGVAGSFANGPADFLARRFDALSAGGAGAVGDALGVIPYLNAKPRRPPSWRWRTQWRKRDASA